MSGSSYNQFFRDSGPEMMDPFLGSSNMYGEDQQSQQSFNPQMFMDSPNVNQMQMNRMNVGQSQEDNTVNFGQGMVPMNMNMNMNDMNSSNSMSNMGKVNNMGNMGDNNMSNGMKNMNMGNMNLGGNMNDMGMNSPMLGLGMNQGQMPMGDSMKKQANQNQQMQMNPMNQMGQQMPMGNPNSRINQMGMMNEQMGGQAGSQMNQMNQMGNQMNQMMSTEQFRVPMKRGRDGTQSPAQQGNIPATPLPNQLLQDAHSGSSSPIMRTQPQAPFQLSTNQQMQMQRSLQNQRSLQTLGPNDFNAYQSSNRSGQPQSQPQSQSQPQGQTQQMRDMQRMGPGGPQQGGMPPHAQQQYRANMGSNPQGSNGALDMGPGQSPSLPQGQQMLWHINSNPNSNDGQSGSPREQSFQMTQQQQQQQQRPIQRQPSRQGGQKASKKLPAQKPRQQQQPQQQPQHMPIQMQQYSPHANSRPPSQSQPRTASQSQPQPQMQQQPMVGPAGQQPNAQSRADIQARQEAFIKSYLEFMQRRGTPVREAPTVCGKRLNILPLYGAIQKLGGSVKVTREQKWPLAAQSLGFDLSASADAPRELYKCYMALMQPFEEALFVQAQARMKAVNAASTGGGDNSSAMARPQSQGPVNHSRNSSLAGDQQLPQQIGTPSPRPPSQQFGQQSSVYQKPTAQSPAMQPQPEQSMKSQAQSMVSSPAAPRDQAAIPAAGGAPFAPYNMGPASHHQPSPNMAQRIVSNQPSPVVQPFSPSQRPHSQNSSVSRHTSVSRTPVMTHVVPPEQIPEVESRQSQAEIQSQAQREPIRAEEPLLTSTPPVSSVAQVKEPIHPPLRLTVADNKYVPRKRLVAKHGGNDMQMIAGLGMEIEQQSADFPLLFDLGTISLHALTMSLKSKIPGEVRQALDKLLVATADQRLFLSLRDTPSLLGALSEVGLDLIDQLGLSEEQKGPNVNRYLTINSNDDDIDTLLAAWKSKCGEKDIIVSSATPKVDVVMTTPVDMDQDASKGLPKATEELKDEGEDRIIVPQQFKFKSYLELFESTRAEAEGLAETLSSTEEFQKSSLIHRLLAVTTILRNVSCMDPNKPFIPTNLPTVRFIFKILRKMASSSKFIATSKNQLDLMKDLVIILSNIAPFTIVENPCDAFTLILFLLAFAPTKKVYDKSGHVVFGQYAPSLHRYLPYAVDVMVKLLPRDPPNRETFRSVFLNTCTNEEFVHLWKVHYLSESTEQVPRPYDLLTKCFGLAICTMPHTDLRIVPRGLELLRPLLQQSLLLAELLADMVPGKSAESREDSRESSALPDSVEKASDKATDPMLMQVRQNQRKCNLALEWLSSTDAFAPVLLRAACALGAVVGAQGQGQVNRQEELNPFARITQRCVSVLRVLGRKVIQGNETLPVGVLPNMELLLGALLAGDMDKFVVRHICSFCDEGKGQISA